MKLIQDTWKKFWYNRYPKNEYTETKISEDLLKFEWKYSFKK